MPRALLVSWLFPPQLSIGAKRAYRFARHLPSLGWEATVLTRRRAPARAYDPTPHPLPDGVRVLRDYDHAAFPALEDALSGGGERARAVAISRGPTFAERATPLETEAIHAPHLAAVLDRELPRHDLVWTTSFPFHTHLVAMRAARRHGTPWVADLRDPWTDNWNHRHKLPLTRALEARWEREVFARADAVVVTAEGLAQRYRQRFPRLADKFVAVHNCWDGPTPTPAPRVDDGALRLVHFGNVYGPRSLRTVLAAMARLRDDPSAPKVHLENLGSVSTHDMDVVRSLGLSDRVTVSPPLPWAEGISRLASADLLVLADWGVDDGALFVPGKLYDYLLAARPMLAETRHRELRDIVARTGSGRCVDPGDVSAVCEALGDLAAGRPVSPTPRDDDAVRYYSAPEATARLAAIFDRVSSRARP